MNNGAAANVSGDGAGDSDGWRLMAWWQLWSVYGYYIFWSNKENENGMFFMYGFFYPLVQYSKEND